MTKTICFTVTNDLTYDQRMIRICHSMVKAGYDVLLVGRLLPGSLPLLEKPYRQKRIKCFFNKGGLFYAEYNLRLFFYLLFRKIDLICSIDLDTILPGFFISVFRQIPRVYDAHEYFTEMKELLTRPRIRKIWTAVEKFSVPRYVFGYTVSEGLSRAFQKNYSRNYAVISNFPVLKPLQPVIPKDKFILFQGAVNEARGFEYLIPAMKQIPYKLVICGDGNFMDQLKELIRLNHLESKVELTGMLLPEQLLPYAQSATLGIGLAEKEGINQYYALPNKFTDYIHAGLPQIAMNFPEYKKINDRFRVAVLIDDLSIDKIIKVINETMQDDLLLSEMKSNALLAREVYCWDQEEKKLLAFYKEILKD